MDRARRVRGQFEYPFLGGIRSSAQMISYEIAMGIDVIPCS